MEPHTLCFALDVTVVHVDALCDRVVMRENRFIFSHLDIENVQYFYFVGRVILCDLLKNKAYLACFKDFICLYLTNGSCCLIVCFLKSIFHKC